jgi:hypothetical protein
MCHRHCLIGPSGSGSGDVNHRRLKIGTRCHRTALRLLPVAGGFSHVQKGDQRLVERLPFFYTYVYLVPSPIAHRSQLAVVGTGFPDLEGNVAIGSIDYRDQGRARVIGKNAGLIRIYSPA